MRVFLSLLFFLFLNFFSYGQGPRNYAQELFDLLMNGRYFEAKEFKLQYQDKLPSDIDQVYNIYMSSAFNKFDSTIIYLEAFLNDPILIRKIGPSVGQYYVGLYETYASILEFGKAISTMERYVNYLKENPFSMDAKTVSKEIDESKIKISLLKEKLANGLIRRIVIDKKENKIKLKNDPHILFDALYNGHMVETSFDTDITTELCIMEKNMADEIGVKYEPTQDSVCLIKGKPTKAVHGYLDSIQLDGIKLYNIPVLVLVDKFMPNPPIQTNPDFKQYVENNLPKNKQVLFGLQIMRLIGGRFNFDWKSNTLTIVPAKVQKSNRINLNPNIAFIGNALYLHMKINETMFTGFLDLNADHYLFLTYSFFFKSNSDYIKNDTQKQPYTRLSFMKIQENVERYRVENPKIYFDGGRIDTNKSNRNVYTVADINNFDGEVGISFFKNISSNTVIDFNSMRIECKD